MGFLVEDEEEALMWRGLMLNRAVQHFLEDVAWPADIDYLLIDMPPGTGDVQMGLARMLPQAEMLIVTTPALAAQKVAARAATMARKTYLRICGVVENMSAFVAPDGQRHALFGEGGGEALAALVGAPLLARIPIEAAVAAGGDDGEPVALGEGPAADAFRALARRVVDEAVPPVDMSGCSARLVSAMEAAFPSPASTPSPERPRRRPERPGRAGQVGQLSSGGAARAEGPGARKDRPSCRAEPRRRRSRRRAVDVDALDVHDPAVDAAATDAAGRRSGDDHGGDTRLP